jgi:hypothetical protein
LNRPEGAHEHLQKIDTSEYLLIFTILSQNTCCAWLLVNM